MSESCDFRALLNEKLAAMALEISELFDRMIVQHEKEMQVLKQRNTRQQRHVESLMEKPRVVLRRPDLQILSSCCLEDGPRLDIKEEEVSVKLVPEQLQEALLSEDNEEKPVSIDLNPNGLGADETPPHSEPGDTAELAGDPSTGHVPSDSGVRSRCSSDTEDSDECSSGPFPGRARKKVRKSLRTTKPVDIHTNKQNKQDNDKGRKVLFECAQCLKTFSPKTCSVRRKKPTSCSACSAKSKSKVQEKNRQFFCSDCDEGFTRLDNLSSHMLIHKEQGPHSCTVCGKSFREQGRLKKHMRIHTGEKPFSCSVCNKSFTHRTRDKHLRSHQGERPFCCSECGARFKKKSHLIGHLVVHSGERPFSCPVCKKTYKRKNHVTAHMKVMHGKKGNRIRSKTRPKRLNKDQNKAQKTKSGAK